tara:strand:- start:434 stop:889 length:456 start_codon:yes stop_codon:yes gene_type:complete
MGNNTEDTSVPMANNHDDRFQENNAHEENQDEDYTEIIREIINSQSVINKYPNILEYEYDSDADILPIDIATSDNEGNLLRMVLKNSYDGILHEDLNSVEEGMNNLFKTLGENITVNMTNEYYEEYNTSIVILYIYCNLEIYTKLNEIIKD